MRRVLFFILLYSFSFHSLGIADPVLIKEEALKVQLEKIAVLEKQKKFDAAQHGCERILKKYALTASQLRKVRKRLATLNVQSLISDVKIPGSVIYTVKGGDSLFELAKKYKTNMELIRKINHLKNDELIQGSRLKVINGTFEIRVNKTENELSLFFNKKLVKNYPVTTGANNKTPAGTYRIINKVENPTWYFQNQVIPAESKANMLGTRWMGFDKQGYGIHGTVEPEAIGKQASLGCVRMLNPDVEELYLLVPLETSVTIKD